MVKASQEFQVFVKPTGAACNLGCHYCYYLDKSQLHPDTNPRLSGYLLKEYIKQHIESSPDTTITFSWHGGEPTLLGVDYYREVAKIQKKYKPTGKSIFNGLQTNGTLLDDEWCRFLSEENFSVGLSLDGPAELHDIFRRTKDNTPTHSQVIKGYNLLKKHGVQTEILCVVNTKNVKKPLRLYRYFRQLKAQFISFLPLVTPESSGVSEDTVSPDEWGDFLTTIFNEWIKKDIGRIKVQIFEEALRTAFNQENSLCIFRPTCGDIPVLEHNGDIYTCDHYVTPEHLVGNLKETPLLDLLESPTQIDFGKRKQQLPRQCRTCDVLDMCNGGCPKNRFTVTSDGEQGLNYLCMGYREFFRHCKPFVETVAEVWRQQTI